MTTVRDAEWELSTDPALFLAMMGMSFKPADCPEVTVYEYLNWVMPPMLVIFTNAGPPTLARFRDTFVTLPEVVVALALKTTTLLALFVIVDGVAVIFVTVMPEETVG